MRKLLLLGAASLALAFLATKAPAQCPGVNCTLPSVMNAPIQGITPSYATGFTGLAVNAAAGDVLQICGSASKTIKITKVYFSGRATSVAGIDVSLIRRSAANSGGTPTTETAVKMDSNSGTATATVTAFAGLPTAGAWAGVVASMQYFLGNLTTGVSGPPLEFEFGGARPAQAVVLRGASQCVSLSLNAGSLSGNLSNAWLEWTEE